MNWPLSEQCTMSYPVTLFKYCLMLRTDASLHGSTFAKYFFFNNTTRLTPPAP